MQIQDFTSNCCGVMCSVFVALIRAILRSKQHSKGLPWQVYTGVRLKRVDMNRIRRQVTIIK